MSEDSFGNESSKEPVTKKPTIPGWQGPPRTQEESAGVRRIDEAIRENLPRSSSPEEVNPSAGVDPKEPQSNPRDPRP